MSTTPAYPTGRGLAGQPRAAALGLVAALYVIVILAAWAVAAALPHRHPLTAVAAADIVATLIVFLASMAVANSSMYDPYWSVAPPVVAIYLLTQAPGSLPGGVVTRHVAVIVLILVWAVRLTGNWAWGWPGFRHEDWRYVDMRNDSGGRAPWAAVSFLGVHLFPTIIVFLAMLPLWPALAAGTHGLGPLDALAVVVTAGAIALELVADVQLHRFTGDAAHRGQIMNRGLWSISRHPNSHRSGDHPQ